MRFLEDAKRYRKVSFWPFSYSCCRSQAVCWLLAFVALCTTSGCRPASGPEVVVYTALDEVFSADILDDFSRTTGIRAVPKFDTESTKTVGLANAILAESRRPRCDVFWNNEILNTLRLERAGLLDAYHPLAADDYPAMYRSPQGTWHGFAARARVLIVNTQQLAPQQRPDSITDLAAPRWRGRIALAKPLFGTTATHAACLFAAWGDKRARQFFLDLKANRVSIESGNKQVAVRVATGQLAFGLTDTDDALVMIAKGYPVEIVYPDQGPDGLGTLFIPNTVAILRNAPHPEAARRLVDYLLSPQVESRLATGPSGQIPLNRRVQVQPPVATPRTIRAMQVDFEKAADCWDRAARFLRQHFASP